MKKSPRSKERDSDELGFLFSCPWSTERASGPAVQLAEVRLGAPYLDNMRVAHSEVTGQKLLSIPGSDARHRTLELRE